MIHGDRKSRSEDRLAGFARCSSDAIRRPSPWARGAALQMRSGDRLLGFADPSSDVTERSALVVPGWLRAAETQAICARLDEVCDILGPRGTKMSLTSRKRP